jgi:hypothetical protein
MSAACSLVPRLWIDGEPNQVISIGLKKGHLANFLASSRPPIRLAMAILFRNSRHQFIQRVLPATRAQHNASISFQVERQPVTFR